MSDKSEPEKKPVFTRQRVAMGVGSAALVAALLYASTKRSKKPKPGEDE